MCGTTPRLPRAASAARVDTIAVRLPHPGTGQEPTMIALSPFGFPSSTNVGSVWSEEVFQST